MNLSNSSKLYQRKAQAASYQLEVIDRQQRERIASTPMGMITCWWCGDYYNADLDICPHCQVDFSPFTAVDLSEVLE